jgi:uncharacterized membrane protein YdbT with pleckstrin-like domain
VAAWVKRQGWAAPAGSAIGEAARQGEGDGYRDAGGHWFVVCLSGALAIVAAAVVASQPILAGGAVLPAIYALVKVLKVRTTRIEVTTERVTTTVGIFSRQKWDLELYRVKDTTLHEPFLLRLVGRANIIIVSSDRSSPTVTLPALPDAEWLRQQIRSNVERLRLKRGVRELDIQH